MSDLPRPAARDKEYLYVIYDNRWLWSPDRASVYLSTEDKEDALEALKEDWLDGILVRHPITGPDTVGEGEFVRRGTNTETRDWVEANAPWMIR